MINQIVFYLKSRNKSGKYLMTLVLFILYSGTSYSQSVFPNLTFRTLNTKDGLSDNTVNYITQGDDGQMWLGTANGLNSYDGNKFTNYYRDKGDGIELNQNGISTMLKDSFNNLWISDRVGLTKISLNNFKTTFYRQFQTINKLAHFRKGILFASDAGIFTIEDTAITRIKIPFEAYWVDSDKIDQFNSAISDRENNLYLGSAIRVHKISAQRKEIKYYQTPNRNSIIDIYFDKNNCGWVCTWGGGLLQLDQKADSLRQVLKPEHSNAITGPAIEWKIGNREYLVARVSTDKENGIILLDRTSLNYKFYDLKTNVNSVFIDRNGNLWLGVKGQGALIVSHLQGIIESIPIVTTKNNPKYPTANVYTIHETKEHFWLNKRYYQGIFKYDKNWNLIKEFGSFNVKDIYQINQIEEGYDFNLVGNTMYCTNDLGMFLIDNNTHERKQIFTPERANVKLRSIVPVNDSTWFIRSFSKGIYVFNPKTNAFINKYELPKPSSNFGINYLIKTSQNFIIASTNQGLYYYDDQLDKFSLVDHPVLNNLYIFGMAEDQNNLLWLSTSKGILSYNMKKNQIISEFDQYAEMGTSYRVAVDSSNNVWFSNEKGYWSWDQKKKRMLKLNIESGVISGFDDSFIHVSHDGLVYLGGKDVVYKLNPKILSAQLNSTRVIVSRITVNNEFKIPTYNQGNYHLNLPAGRAALQIEFAVPDYRLQQSHDYQFKFSDSDHWTATKDGKIFIPNLSHGKYNILMKGISNFSGEETGIVTLYITIQPFLYQSWWFKVLMALALLSLFYLFYKWRLASENEKSKLKAEYEHRMVLLEMQKLRSQMNPHFIFNALNSINGFIVENQTHLASDYLTKFSRLIRMILDHSKSDMISLTKELEALNLYVMMEKNRFDQSFDFQITIAEHIDTDQIEVPPLILQPYIENSIWHGLMHQQKKGYISLIITQEIDQLCFAIEDNGVGRQKAGELKSKKNVKSNSYGMQITYNRIKDHHFSNTVEISDILDSTGKVQGTRVIILLKIE